MGLDMYLMRKDNNEELVYWRKANAVHSWFCELAELKYSHTLEDMESIDVSVNELMDLSRECHLVLGTVRLVDGMMEREEYRQMDGDKWKTVKRSVPTRIVDNVKFCEEHMPIMRGYFFGSYEYDAYYLSQLRRTVAQIDELIDDFYDEEGSNDVPLFYYHAWW